MGRDPIQTEPCTASASTSRGRRFRRRLLLVAGFVSLGLGVLGIPLPILPTTPFVILAAICFSRSSGRCHRWLIGNRLFGRFLCDYLEGRGVPWGARIPVLLLLWTVIGLTAVLVVEHVAIRVALFVVAAGVTTHVSLLKRPGRRISGEHTKA